ncbi:MAG: hydroxymethylbilane synthase [Bacteroidota bacterium]
MIIGTRGSKLALWQAHWVQQKLRYAGIESQLKIISTEGDQRTDVPLHTLSTTGLFTKALDQALLRKEIDLAVHSAKDMASSLIEGIYLLAFMEREDPRDVLLADSDVVQFDNLSRPLTVGTSSIRRQYMIRHFFPHIQLKELRGNVDSRLAKMEKGEYDGIMLALAGVKRMGFTSKVVQKLHVDSFTPAVGQGAVAVVCHEELEKKDILQEILNHQATAIAVQAERAFLRTLGGGCSQPVFGHATVFQDKVRLTCGKLLHEGKELVRETAEDHVDQVIALGERLAQNVLTTINN